MISIIIPTLNEEKVIGRAIGSFTDMQMSHEVIVSDGASKDRTVEIARGMGARVYEHDNSHRQTIAEGRNVGGMAATGDILVFLDADVVIFEPDRFFGEVAEYFGSHPDVVAVSPALKVLPEYATWADRLVMFGVNISYRIFTNALHLPSAPGECQIMRASTYRAIGGYDKSLTACEDLDLFKRLGEAGKVRHLPHLYAWHTCRRAHKTGWPKLLFLWFKNALTFSVIGKVYQKEWIPIR